MAEIWSKFTLVMPTERDYGVMAVIAKMYDRPENWPVLNYAEEEKRIEFDEVLAYEDDVIEFASVLNEHLQTMKMPTPDYREKMNAVVFAIEGTTMYHNSGEQVDYIIERNIDGITIQETENYRFYGSYSFDNYEDFCERVEDDWLDPKALLKEEDFDPECEYAVAYSKIYIDRHPEYGQKKTIDRFKREKEPHSVNEEIIEYFKANGLPYDDKTIEKLSVEDVYAIMAGEYGKENAKSD